MKNKRKSDQLKFYCNAFVHELQRECCIATVVFASLTCKQTREFCTWDFVFCPNKSMIYTAGCLHPELCFLDEICRAINESIRMRYVDQPQHFPHLFMLVIHSMFFPRVVAQNCSWIAARSQFTSVKIDQIAKFLENIERKIEKS